MSDESLRGAGAWSALYRRGALMGLTVAEVFILLAFVLLLLMTLWHAENQRRLSDYREMSEQLRPLQQLDAQTRGWLDLAIADGRLAELAHEAPDPAVAMRVVPAGELAMLRAAERAMDPLRRLDEGTREWLMAEVADGRLPEVARHARSLRDGARLVEKTELLALIDAVDGLPEVRRDAFVELIRGDGYSQVVDWAHEIGALIEAGHSPSELLEALSLLDALDPDALRDVESLKARIRAALAETQDLGRSMAGAVQGAVGDLVHGIGGSIDAATGAVTLPDTALFAKGSAELSPQTTAFLDGFCVPWIGTLSRFDEGIRALRIEGHASSEWDTTDDAEEAFLNNMGLSQARASAVLDYCLRRVAAGHVGPWARARLVAVGYSSARPIIEDGHENPVKSRRVVFRPELDNRRLLDRIEAQVAEPGGAPAPRNKPTHTDPTGP